MTALVLALLLGLASPRQELPGSWLDRFQLAEGHLDASELDEAVTALEACLELAPENATTGYHLACAHARAGRTDDALDWLERAVAWGWGDADVIEWDADLAPLRGEARYGLCVAGARALALPSPPATRLVADPLEGEPRWWSEPSSLVLAWGDEARVVDTLAREVIETTRAVDEVFGPDLEGRLLVGRLEGSATRVLDALTGETVLSLEGPLPVRQLFLGTGGEQLFGVVEDTEGVRWVRRWSPAGELVPSAFGFGCSQVAVSPDGRRVITAEYQRDRARLFDALSGRQLAQPWGDAAVSTEAKRLAGDGRVVGFLDGRVAWYLNRGRRLHLIDAESGRTLRILPPEGWHGVRTFQADPTTGTVLTGDPGVVRWWRADRDEPVRELATGDRGVPRLFLPPDGRLLLTSTEDGPLRAWDARTGEPLWSRPSAGRWRFLPGYPPDGAVLIEDQDRLLVVRARSGDVATALERRGRGAGRVDRRRARPLPDGDQVALVGRGSIQVLDLPTARVVRTLQGVPQGYWTVESSQDGERLVVSVPGATVTWDLASGAQLARLDAGGELAPGGELFELDAGDGSLALVATDDGRERFRVRPAGGPRGPHGWSPDGRWLAVADEAGRVSVHDARSGEPAAAPLELAAAPKVVAVSSDGRRVVTCVGEHDVRLWEVGSREAPLDLSEGFTGLGQAVSRVLFDPSGELVVCVTWDWSDYYAFDAGSGERRWVMWPGGDHGSARFTPSGRRLQDDMGLVDLATGELVFGGDEADIYGVQASADDRWVVAWRDGALVVFDGEHFEERYARIVYEDGSALQSLPNRVHHGDRRAVRDARLVLDDVPYPLDGFAPFLYDPKRLRAAIAGVPLKPPRLPTPPSLLVVRPAARVHEVAGEQATLTVRAGAPDGVAGFQLERDGAVLPAGLEGVQVTHEGRGALLTWTLRRPPSGQTHLRLRAIGARGALSRPALLTLVWP